MTGPTGRAPAHGILARVLLLTSLGIIGPSLVLAWALLAGVRDEAVRVEADRRAVAASLSAGLERTVRDAFETLAAVPVSGSFDAADGIDAAERSALHSAFIHTRAFDSVVLTSAGGVVVAEEPDRRRAWLAGLGDRPEARAVLASGRPGVLAAWDTPEGLRQVFLVAYRDRTGTIAGLVGGLHDPRSGRLAPAWPTNPAPPGLSVALVDRFGVVVASRDEASLRARMAHAADLAPLLGASEPMAAEVRPAGGEPEVVAAAPLLSLPWVVVVRQPRDLAVHAARSVRDRLLVLGLPLLGLAILFSWGAARSLTRPLSVLRASAERIAAGDLRQPIPNLPGDEIGRLGRALEAMRGALRHSMERITAANEDLERRVAERTRDLEAAHARLRVHDEQRGRVLSRVISAQEDERKRIARELHDETCQKLAAIGMRLDLAASAPPETARQSLAEARQLATGALDDVHRVIFDLRPSVLDDLGLLAAIRWYAARHLEPAGIKVRVECGDLDLRLPQAVETALFRAVQEALNNVRRHSEAESALVQIERRDGTLDVQVEDDGRGFDVAEVANPSESGRGLGLAGMRERLELVGGTADVDSSPGDGTRVTLRVPFR